MNNNIPAHNFIAKPQGLYVYEAMVNEVYDGDTITVNVDLGFHTQAVGEKLRLFGINAPEMRGPEKGQGTITRDWLREMVLGKRLLLETFKSPKGFDKKGKFGRYLVKLFLEQEDGLYLDINAELVSLGLAQTANY